MFGVGINPAFSTPESFPFGEKMLLLYPKSAQPTSSIRMKMIFGPEENEYRYLKTLLIRISNAKKLQNKICKGIGDAFYCLLTCTR